MITHWQCFEIMDFKQSSDSKVNDNLFSEKTYENY